MNRFIPTFLCLLLSLISLQVFSQKIPPPLAQNLDSSLYEHFKGEIPHHFCPCNNCEHWYNGKFKAIKTGRKSRPVSEDVMEERIAVWGVAGADQYSPFGSSKTTVQIYAEYILIGGEYQLTMLKWKQSDCMKYRVLVEDKLSKTKELEDVEDQVTAWALESDVELDTPKELANPSGEERSEEQGGEVLEWALDAKEGDFNEHAEWIIDPNVLDREEEPKAKTTEEEFIAAASPSQEEVKQEAVPPAPLQLMTEKEEGSTEIAVSAPSDSLDLTVAKLASEQKPDKASQAEPAAAVSKDAIKEGILSWSLTGEEDSTQETIAEKEPIEKKESQAIKPDAQISLEIGITSADDKTLEKNPQARVMSVSLDNPTDIKYKDAVLVVDYLTKTETVLGTETQTIYEYFLPKEKTTISIPLTFPEHAMTVQVRLEKIVEVKE
ncbi:MAG: hypothetical protein AAF587_02925 [Bacteroidota bacterium]